MAKACNLILHVRCMFVQKRALVSACVHGHNRVCVSCLLNRSKSVRNEGEALIHCSSNTISVRLRLCSKFLAAKCLSYRSRQNIMAWHCIISPTVPFAYIKGWTFCVMPGLYSSLHVHRPAQMLTGPTKLCLGR